VAIELHGRVIAITGASSGIGAATAKACARAGMSIALFARREDRLREVAARCGMFGAATCVVVGDAAEPADNQRLLDEAARALGPVYAVFANAGYGVEADACSMPEDDIRRMFEVNFFGSLDLVRRALPAMRSRGEGHTLLCSSCLAKLGLPRYGCYSATKACQDHFARAMRHELSGTGVAVSSVHPVGTKTEFFDTAAALSAGGASMLDRGSKRFMQPPERVASAVVRRLRTGRGGEVWTSLPARLAFGAATMLPGLTDALVGRAMSRRLAGAAEDRTGAPETTTPAAAPRASEEVSRSSSEPQGLFGDDAVEPATPSDRLQSSL
jgi:short-subunit dehydrogenase